MSDGHEDGARPPGYRLMLREMAADERPREKLKLRGSAALSDGELLAIILNTGSRGGDRHRSLAAAAGALRRAARNLSPGRGGVSADARGLGDAKAVRLKAALELGGVWPRSPRRSGPWSARRRTSPTCSASRWRRWSRKNCGWSCWTPNTASWAPRRSIAGSVNQAQVRVAEVFRDAVRQQATAIVAVHNHPSGDPTPSAADVALTVEIVAAGQLLDIELLDHLIIGQGRWLSLKRLGLGFPKA